MARDRTKTGLQGHFFSQHHSTFGEPGTLGHVGRCQTYLRVIGSIRLVSRVGEAHPGWRLKVQNVGDLEGRRNELKGFPTLSKCPDTQQDPQLRLYQVPRIGVILQGGTIWLDLKRKERSNLEGQMGGGKGC